MLCWDECEAGWRTVVNHHEEPSWSCDFVGAYHGLVPKCCCFSADGSLLAVSFQEVVTVWSPASWDLLTTLSQPPGAIQNLCFGRLSCSKYLLGSTRHPVGTTDMSFLCCWNLLTCSRKTPCPQLEADLQLLSAPLLHGGQPVAPGVQSRLHHLKLIQAGLLDELLLHYKSVEELTVDQALEDSRHLAAVLDDPWEVQKSDPSGDTVISVMADPRRGTKSFSPSWP
ncbi:hypothetical protein CRUP_023422 [Coryphaenoides rupestris]|nr:hypothetical protein CRUP_023422 [Coryphaenoides rupestris]